MGLLGLFGKKIGFAAVVWGEPIYTGALGQVLRAFNAITPTLGIGLFAFNVAVIVQEFTMLFRSRAKSGAGGALVTRSCSPGSSTRSSRAPPPPSRRRATAGAVVHFGIVLMFIGFTGKSWTVDQEATLAPGLESMQIDHYKLEYVNERMEVDLDQADDLRRREGHRPGTTASSSASRRRRSSSTRSRPTSPTTEVCASSTSIRDDHSTS